ncbi:MAG: DUF1365 domain-containing protein [Planctomycetaceae bacterium]
MSANNNPPLHSCLYTGTVSHCRHVPKPHAFQYRLFQVYLDLSELERLGRENWLISNEGWGIARFGRNDHLGRREEPLDESVRRLVQRETGQRLTGPIRLLTHLRYFGFLMNPVSFYYCFDEQDEHVEAVVAEVNNTPWNEQHCYVLNWKRDSAEASNTLQTRQAKEFHVSPFMEMDMEYRWQLAVPNESLDVSISNFRGEDCLFNATLHMQREPLTNWNMLSHLVAFPCMTAKVYAAIHWEALRLWWKGIPYVPHPKTQSQPVSS